VYRRPSARDNDQWSEALCFRNADRTQFGKVEIVGTTCRAPTFDPLRQKSSRTRRSASDMSPMTPSYQSFSGSDNR
jgi:hypothetical protein